MTASAPENPEIFRYISLFLFFELSTWASRRFVSGTYRNLKHLKPDFNNWMECMISAHDIFEHLFFSE